MVFPPQLSDVPQDLVQAHMWIDLAAVHGHETTQEAREIVAKRMPPDQLAEAQHMAREWMAKHPQ